MLCHKCIGKLALNLSVEARAILSVLVLGVKNQNQITLTTKLSYAVTYRALKELTSACFVQCSEKGRSKEYELTDSGRVLVSLCRKEGRQCGIQP